MAAQHRFFLYHKMNKSLSPGTFLPLIKFKCVKMNKLGCLLVVRVRFSEVVVLMQVRSADLHGVTILQFFRCTG